MQISRPSNKQHLVFSKFMCLTSLYLGPVITFFLTILFLMICRSPVNLFLRCLSVKGGLFHLNSRLSGFVKNKYKSILLTSLLKLKNVVDIGGVSL